jgi:hypothetical protein
MTSIARTLALLVSASVVTGCGAQSGVTPNSAAAGPSTSKRGTATVHITIPKKPKGHGARFVSPATVSMTLAISGPTPVTATVGLTAGSTGCVGTNASTACSLKLTLTAGAYTANVSTYDVAGHLLSGVQSVPFTVTAGTNNAIALTLAGAISRFLVTPADAFSANNVAGGLDLYGTGAHTLLVQALDVDGNSIVGAGAPTYSVAYNTGNFTPVLTQPLATRPNAFTVQPPANFTTGTATIGITASFTGQPMNGCALPGAVCTASVNVAMKTLVAVANGNHTVTLYGQLGGAPLATIAETSATYAVAFDPSGDLFVGTSSTIIEYAPPYTGSGFPLTGSTGATQLAGDPNSGNVYAIAGTSGQAFTPPFLSAPVTLAIAMQTATAIAVDQNGNIYLASTGAANRIDGFKPGFTTPTYALTPPGAINSLTIDGNNRLFAGDATGDIDYYSAPQGGGSPTASFASANTTGVAVDPTGNLFVTQCATCNALTSPDQVVEFRRASGFNSGTTPYKTLTAGVANDTGLAVDGAALLFVMNKSANNLAEFVPDYNLPPATVSTGINAPAGVAVSPNQ